MARGGNKSGPSVLQEMSSSPEIQNLWTVSDAFARRHGSLPHAGHAPHWVGQALQDRSQYRPLSHAKAAARIEILRALTTWPSFRHRPMLHS